MSVADNLRESANVFEERGKVYGEAYKVFGPVFAALFPTGLTIYGPEDANRLGVFVQILSKVVRYAGTFKDGGHDDSLVDLSTYAAMLRELDGGRRERLFARISNAAWNAPPGEFVELQEEKGPLPWSSKPIVEERIPVGVPRGFRVGPIEPEDDGA